MSETKPKLSLPTAVISAQKSPSPSPKLMLNHGKPNFTINRSKTKTDSQCPFTPSQPETTSIVKSNVNNTLNGYVRPSVIKIPLSEENEISKVVLRRTKRPEENGDFLQQEEELEFVKAQRKIAERLANQKNLDFESRKSGYFTHVMISPSSPTKQMENPVVPNNKGERASFVNGDVSDLVVAEHNKPEISNEINSVKNVAETDDDTKKFETSYEPAKENSIENGHENLIEENNVVEVAKAMVGGLVENAVLEVQTTAEEVSKSLQNVHENGVENDVQNGNENVIKDELSNGITSSLNGDTGDAVSTELKSSEHEDLLKDMYKMKFDIHAGSESDVKVIPTVTATE